MDFFKKPLQIQEQTASQQKTDDRVPSVKPQRTNTMRTSGGTTMLVKQISETLEKCGFSKMASKVEKIISDVNKDRFVVAVVGEFNRGKSTFVNNLLGHDVELPVGTLPTTAVMTRIRYAKESKMAVFDDKGARVGMLELNKDSWEGLVANNFSEQQPRGSVIVGIPNQWLGHNCIEIIDCPGAGDLSEERAQQIVDTLDRTDAAIINLDATAALSMTEKEFILQRILKRKTPFTMIVINKLDLIKKEERSGIIKYVKDVLAINKMNIPVYIPSDIEMSDNNYSDIQGLETIRNIVVSWATDPKRQVLTDLWVKAKVLDVIVMAIEALKEQQTMYDKDNIQAQEIILKKKNDIEKLELLWGELELNMQRRANDCYKSFLEKVEEYKMNIIERLQYEASHASAPDKWWKEDYPYRLKVELANLSVGLENITSRLVATDARWLNQILDQKFKNYVQINDVSITNKKNFTDVTSERVVKFENISKQKNVAKVATAGLSVASYFAIGLLGLPAVVMGAPIGIIASIGIGTGGGILQNIIFKRKIEDQREQVKLAIAKDIPIVVDKATEKSEHKIRVLYDSIIDESSKKKELWVENQNAAIEANNKPKSAKAQELTRSFISELETISSKLN